MERLVPDKRNIDGEAGSWQEEHSSRACLLIRGTQMERLATGKRNTGGETSYWQEEPRGTPVERL
jgi:hypothetical protein